MGNVGTASTSQSAQRGIDLRAQHLASALRACVVFCQEVATHLDPKRTLGV